MHPVISLLSELKVGEPLTFRQMSIFPLRSSSRPVVDYLLLSDALQDGLVSVRETSRSGSVPELVVENRADRPVLIVDGEELVGAKQNRVANLTLLVAASKSTTIPVSCVEQGRWSWQSDEFAASERVQFARGRARKLASVQASMRVSGTRFSDQGAVWDEIGVKAAAMHARSPTGAMSAIFEEHAECLDEFVNRLQAQPGQTGGLFALGEAICGLDVFDKPATFVALLPKLVRSYGIDALERPAQSRAAPDVDAARDFLAHLACGKLEEHPATGLGYDVRIEAPGVIAGGLVAESSLIHLAAFAEQRASQAVSSDPGRFADRHQRQYALQCRR